MVEQYEKLPPIYDIIVDAFREAVDDPKEISIALEDLINKDCIVYLKRSNNYLKLKESSGVDIPSEIEKKIESNKGILRVKDVLNNSSFDSYMYPTRYNDEHEITRYFDFLFIDSKEFWSTEDWGLKIADTMADGVVYAIIPESKEDIAKIAKKISSESCENRIVFCLPKKFTDIEKVAFEYNAVLELKDLVVDDDLLKDEYEIYIEDLGEVSDVINDVKNDGLIHFTTPENAAAIIKSGEFIGSTAGLVFPATVILGKQVWTYRFKGLDDVEQKHSYLLKKIKVKKDVANFSVCLKLSGFDEKDLKRIRTRILRDKPIVFKTDNLKPRNIEILREWETDK